jgi:hypothetical protein
MRRLFPLAAIELFVWIALLLSAFLISRVAFAINVGNQTFASRVATETLRVLASGAVAVAWLVIWRWIVDAYFWRFITRRRITP